jgi:carbonic anhydrase/acetyltransferase-like protein (isoleucine patch superfamily)
MPIQNPHGLRVPDSLRGEGLLLPYQDFIPTLGEEIYLAANSVVIGRTILGNRVSVWFGAVLRGDIARIEVGEGSNIQDNAVLHVGDEDPCIVGKNVVVGHLAMLHGCRIEEDCTIGMSAVVLNKAVIGKGSLVGAGALVTQGTIVPPYSLVLGSPAKVIRELTDLERDGNSVFAPKYVGVAARYRAMSI